MEEDRGDEAQSWRCNALESQKRREVEDENDGHAGGTVTISRVSDEGQVNENES